MTQSSNRPAPQLVLASTSVYRIALLQRLGIPFETAAPMADEIIRPGESPSALVRRLSYEKAASVRSKYPGAIIVGSDQVAVFEDTILGKPGTTDKAVQQLLELSGRQVQFLTGLCILNAGTGNSHSELVPTRVDFRNLSRAEIEAYVAADEPLACAGSIKSECLGIALFERVVNDDPTALIGLPLIALCRLLRMEGIDVVTAANQIRTFDARATED